MQNLSEWVRFVTERANLPPLAFVTGFRHQVKRGGRPEFHSHSTIEIVYHPTGRGITRLVGGQSVSFKEGDIVVYAPDELHNQIMGEAGEDLCVRIEIPGKTRKLHGCFYAPAVDDTSIIEEIRLLTRGQVGLSKLEQIMFNLRATSVLYSLVHFASERPDQNRKNTAEEYVRKAEQYLRDHFATIGSLRDIADDMDIGYDHLRHLFKLQRGYSLAKFLCQVRTERAKTLLVHSRVPIKQVATLSGFRDEFYFSSVFRKSVGVAPGRYRATQHRRKTA